MLCAQLERRDQIVASRRRVYATYRRELSGIPGVTFQPQASWVEIAPWLFSILIEEREFGMGRDAIMAELAEAGIESRPFFIPLHTLPPFRRESIARAEHLPITEHIAERGINLPTFPGLSDEEIKLVCATIRRLALRARPSDR